MPSLSLGSAFDHRVAAHAEGRGRHALATASETLGHGTGHPRGVPVQISRTTSKIHAELIQAGLHQATLMSSV